MVFFHSEALLFLQLGLFCWENILEIVVEIFGVIQSNTYI